jgi:hypothetical protein
MFKTLPRSPLRWPSPAEMRAYERAWRKETVKAVKREGDRSARARALALVREQLKDGPKPEASIMAAAEAGEISEHVLIAAACVLRVRTQRGQWWIPVRQHGDGEHGHTSSRKTGRQLATN